MECQNILKAEVNEAPVTLSLERQTYIVANLIKKLFEGVLNFISS